MQASGAMDALSSYDMRASMSRQHNCWGNAPTESLWLRLKLARLVQLL